MPKHCPECAVDHDTHNHAAHTAEYVRPPERSQRLIVEATTVYVIEMMVEAHVTPDEALKQAQQDSCLYEYFQGCAVDSDWTVRLPDDFDEARYGLDPEHNDG